MEAWRDVEAELACAEEDDDDPEYVPRLPEFVAILQRKLECCYRDELVALLTCGPRGLWNAASAELGNRAS